MELLISFLGSSAGVSYSSQLSFTTVRATSRDSVLPIPRCLMTLRTCRVPERAFAPICVSLLPSRFASMHLRLPC